MSTPQYTDQELQQYFADPSRRHRSARENGTSGNGARPTPPRGGYRGWLYQRLGDENKAEGVFAVSMIAGLIVVCTIGVLLYILILSVGGRTPSLDQIDNPNLELATVAYTADGIELGRFGRQNRSWVPLEDMSPYVAQALIATEDRRFYSHWGVDMKGIMAAAADVVRKADLRGASTITQQLARNLYNTQIGFDVSPTRKLKEMATAVQLERNYTKDEILEMYLNTVPFRYNAYGIEAAARTYFRKSAKELDVLESAALVGMLKANTRYDPVRNPELSRQRRNVVMRQMIKEGYLDEEFYAAHRDDVTPTNFRSADVTDSFAPYFAEYVRNWLEAWAARERARGNEVDIYAEGLVVYTTLDSRLQEFAAAAVQRQMEGLQAVVDCEWSKRSGYPRYQSTDPYLEADCEPFAYFWEAYPDLLDRFIRETTHYNNLRRNGLAADAALAQLRQNETFIDSLKTEKTRLEAGLVAMDPHSGYVKAWVGGRDLKADWYDHVGTAKRQPGSTFKPFVYTAAIDNGYSPYYMLPDERFTYRDPVTGQTWSPGNSGTAPSGRMMTLQEGLARSLNTITGQLILEIDPSTAAFYARRMGIQSKLDEVPALALGTSDVSLLEMTSAYSTLANGGLYREPVVVTRIQDKNDNVLYEHVPEPHEAISEATAYTVVDMMRDVVSQSYGTGIRIRGQYGLTGYDFAGKTGTTQESADGWFMLMHPELVTGAWVGFNDRRVTFRTSWWGQGAHNALFLVGDFIRSASTSSEVGLSKQARFPAPEDYGLPAPMEEFERERIQDNENERGRVGW